MWFDAPRRRPGVSVGRTFFTRIKAPEAAAFWWYLPLATGGLAAYESLYHWTLRLRDYRRLMRTRVWQSLSNAAASVGIGLVHSGPLGLLVGAILFQTAGAGNLARAVERRAEGRRWLDRTGWRIALRSARGYLAFAVFGCPAALLNTGGLLLPPLILTSLYGTEVGGAFSFAFRIVSVPMALVGTAVSQVFLAEASPLMADRAGEIRRLFHRLVRRLAPMSLALGLGGLVCPWAFPVVFGADWAQAGEFAALLAVTCAAQLMVSPLSNIAVLTRRQGSQLWLDAVRVTAVILSLWGSHKLGVSATGAVMAFAICMTLLYGAYFIFYARLARGLGSA